MDGEVRIVFSEDGLERYEVAVETLERLADAGDETNKSLADSAREAAKGIDTLGDEVKEAADELDDFVAKGKESETTLKNQAKEMKIFGVSLKDVQNSYSKYTTLLKTSATNIKAATTATRALGLAMKAIPILAVVAALASLLRFFTQTQRGLDLLRVATASVQIVFTKLGDVFEQTGEKIFDAVSNPQKAWEGFVNFLKGIPGAVLNNLANRFTALGKTISLLFDGQFLEAGKSAVDIFTGVEDSIDKTKELVDNASNSLGEFTKEVSNAVSATQRLERAKQSLRDANIDFIKTEAELRAEIEKQRETSNDITKSFTERKAAAEAAFAAENELLAKRLALAQRNVAIIAEENSLSNNLAADNERLAQAQANVANIRAASARIQRRLGTELNSINKQQLDSLKAQREELIKLRAEAIQFIGSLQPLSNELKQTLSEQLNDVFSEIGSNGRPIGETIGKFISEGLQAGLDADKDAIGARIAAAFDPEQSGGIGNSIGDSISNLLGSLEDGLNSDQFQAFQSVFGSVSDAIVSGINKQISAIDDLIDKQSESVDKLEEDLEREQERREQGLSSDVELLEEQLRVEEEKLKESTARKAELQKEAARVELINDSIQQASSLVTAGAKIFEAFSSIPFVGVPLAIAAIAAMFGSFAKLKIDAFNAASQGTSLYTGSNGGAVSDFFGEPAPNGPTDIPGRGKGIGLYDNETGKYMGVNISGRESLIPEPETRQLKPLLDDMKKNPRKYKGVDFSQLVKSIGIPNVGGAVASINNINVINTNDRFITKKQMKEAVSEALTIHGNQMKEYFDNKPDYLAIEKGKKFKLIPVSKNHKPVRI